MLARIHEWEVETGKVFLIGGMRYEEHVRKQSEDFQAKKDKEKLAKVGFQDNFKNMSNLRLLTCILVLDDLFLATAER